MSMGFAEYPVIRALSSDTSSEVYLRMRFDLDAFYKGTHSEEPIAAPAQIISSESRSCLPVVKANQDCQDVLPFVYNGKPEVTMDGLQLQLSVPGKGRATAGHNEASDAIAIFYAAFEPVYGDNGEIVATHLQTQSIATTGPLGWSETTSRPFIENAKLPNTDLGESAVVHDEVMNGIAMTVIERTIDYDGDGDLDTLFLYVNKASASLQAFAVKFDAANDPFTPKN
jgi:hypothetical protein